jgi:Dolichyl-phosphate-mannose-protein mannosyltransferase
MNRLTAAIFLGAFPLLLLALHVGHTIDGGDEGVVLFGAWSLLSGYRPYLDDFQFITPASNYFLYWLWLLFGPNFWVAKGFAIINIYVSCLAIFLTSRLIGPSDQATLSKFIGPFLYCAFSFFWPAINHNTFNACASCVAMFFGAKYLTSGKPFNLAICGLLTGLAILFLQHKGSVLFIAITATLLWIRFTDHERKSLKPILIYSVFAAAPLLTLLNWPLSVLYTNLFEFPLNQYMAVNKTSKVPLALVVIGFALIGAFTISKRNRAIIFILILQTLMLATTLQRSDVAHVLVLTFPMLTILFIPLEKLKSVLRRSHNFKRVGDLGRKLTLIVLLGSGIIVWVVRGPSFENIPAKIPILQEAKAICKTIYAGPFLPGVYYELRLQNPTSFSYLLTNFHTPNQFQKAKAQLELAPPDCAILHYENILNFNYDKNNVVEEFFSNKYIVHQLSGVTKFLVLRK